MAYIRKSDFQLFENDIVDGNVKEDLFFEADDPISFSISLLNKKGYFTALCCSGHPFSDNTLWVSFKEHYKFGTLPAGFYFFEKEKGGSLFICYAFKSDPYDINILKEIVEANTALYNWVRELPDLVTDI